MGNEEALERGNWTGKLDFILSAIGYAVGLGNVWRFPYLAYKNGGASFLFPYIIMLVIAGLPLFFIELAIGQFTSEGPVTCWSMAPMFKGIGYAMIIVSGVVSIYYNMIIAYAIYYMLVSFVSLDESLPWETCDNEWNTAECRQESLPNIPALNETEKESVLYSELYIKDCVMNMHNASTWEDFKNGMSQKYINFADGYLEKFSKNLSWATTTPDEIYNYKEFKSCRIKYTTPSEEYYQRFVLNEENTTDLGDIGDFSLKLTLTLLLAWILIFGCLLKGIKTSGKVVYFTATFPYVILIVLLIRGVTLEGHLDGIEFYVIPVWDKLTDATIWGDAASQIFYSLGIGFGGLLTMSSYNKFHNNCYRDAILVACINCGTSIFAGFAIFSLLGHMAYVTNKDVEDVAKSGAGLAFVAYPDGISRLPGSPIWAFLFFFMILTLGLDSQFAMMETVISGISDLFPRFLRKHKSIFTFFCCIVGFLLGLPLCTEGGGRVLALMNDYSGSYNLMIIALFEIVCLCYVYGINKLRDDIKMMVGFRPGPYWIATWCVITPAAVLFIVIVSAIQYEPSKYGGVTIKPFAEAIGWVMVVVPIFAMVIVAIVQIIRYGLKGSLTPEPHWGPALTEDRTGKYAQMDMDLANSSSNESSPPPYDPKPKPEFDNVAFVSERL